MKVQFKQTSDGIEKALQGMLSRTKTISSYLNRNLFQQYQKAQIARWESEGGSEDMSWQPLTPDYAKFKKRKFASYPGAGNVLMVATGRLAEGAQGRNSAYFNKMVTDEKFVIGINLGALPYATYPGVLRPYMQFKQETLDQWRQGLKAYIQSGREVLE